MEGELKEKHSEAELKQETLKGEGVGSFSHIMRTHVASHETNSQAGALAGVIVLEVWQVEPLHAVDDDGVVRLWHIERDFRPRPIRLDVAYGYHIGCRIGDTHATGWYEN